MRRHSAHSPWRAALRGVPIAFGLLLGCSGPEAPSPEQTVVRLVDRVVPNWTWNVDRGRCEIDDVIRPALGCPALFVQTADVEERAGRLLLSSPVPKDLEGLPLLVRTSVRDRPGIPPVESPWIRIPAPETQLEVEIPDTGTGEEKNPRASVLLRAAEPQRLGWRTEPIPIPSGSELRLAVATSAFGAPSIPSTIEFGVFAQRPGYPDRELFRRSLSPGESEVWIDAAIDLAPLEGLEVAFRFATRLNGPAPPPDAITPYPVWGNPEIVSRRARNGRPNIILISLDTVRADILGGTLGDKRITPFFERLRSEGVSFDGALTTFHSTSASHMSLFTATYPAVHRVTFPTETLSSRVRTLPEQLGEAGYVTGAVTENAMLVASSGFARGFDRYRENRDTLQGAGGIEETFAAGAQWIEEERDSLFFLFLHTYEAHRPHAPDAELLADLPALPESPANWRAYAAEVRAIDRALERLWRLLARLDLLEETLVVITSDHGEEFGEHGASGHGRTLFDEAIRIPLLFWAPELLPRGRSLDDVVSLVDVAPTILEIAGLPPAFPSQGRSLLDAMRGDPLQGHPVRFAEGQVDDIRLVMARTPDRKWIWREDRPELEVYELDTDPGETRPRFEGPEETSTGRALIESYLALRPAPRGRVGEDVNGESNQDETSLSPDVREKLEALGYVE